jgi:hypothetical protein
MLFKQILLAGTAILVSFLFLKKYLKKKNLLLKKHRYSHSLRITKPMRDRFKQRKSFFQIFQVVVVPPPFFSG